MMLLSFPHSAYLVTKAAHSLYNAASASTLTLTGSLPTVAFRCLVRLYTATGKTDVAGRVAVGSENLDFLVAGKKTTTTALSALPTVTTANLNCMIEIIAIDSGGAPIMAETLTSVQIRFEPTSKSYVTPEGQWTQSAAYAMIVNSTVNIGDIIRYNSIDYPVQQIEAYNWLDGTEIYRVLYF